MIPSDLKIERISLYKIKLLWTTSPSTNISWIFLNGELIEGNLDFETSEREITIDIEEEFLIEVHDCPSGITPNSQFPELKRLSENFVQANNIAKEYDFFRVYKLGESQQQISSELLNPNQPFIESNSLIDLRKNKTQANLIKIESKNESGDSSPDSEKQLIIHGIIGEPTSISIVGTDASNFGIQIDA